jgi:hypothetical protein
MRAVQLYSLFVLLIVRAWNLGKGVVTSPTTRMSSRVFLVEQSADFGNEFHQALRILLNRGLSAQLSPPLIFLHGRAFPAYQTRHIFSGM